MYRFIFRVGDPGGDGYDKSVDIMIQCNIPHKQVLEAYTKTALSCGLTHFKSYQYPPLNNNKTKVMCGEYEERTICEDDCDKLAALSPSIKELIEHEGGEFGPETFVELFMEMARVSDKSITYLFSKDDTPVIVDSMGYGLLYS